MKALPLVKLKRRPELASQFHNRQVRIWSKEWRLWWRPNGAGYTNREDEAGVYTFEDAVSRSHHCDPSKGIVYYLA